MVVMVSGDMIRAMMVLAVLFIFFDNNVMVEGRNFLEEKYSKNKSYVKIMNKPAVMSIKTEGGDDYDCVDIYKQPAFDHPLLKNHTLQVEPTSLPAGIMPKDITHGVQNIGLKNKACPNGTVPIRRTRENDLGKTDSNLHFGRKLYDRPFRYFAVASTPGFGFGEYYGARAIMNIWNPKIGNVHSASYSQLWILAGPTSERNTIEVVLAVDPEKYGDSKTRLGIYWTSDNYRSTGCYNLRCPGFVQVNQRIPIDGSFDRVSTYKGKQYEVKIDVFKDPKSGNWYLLKDDIAIGYWPSSLFNHLNTKANVVRWGGEVAQCGGCPFPQMGSGHFPYGGYGVASYMKGLQVIDNTNMVLRDPKNWVSYENKKSCYRIQQNTVGKGILTGFHILYGGPGGSC